MAARIHFLSTKLLPQFTKLQSHPFPITTHLPYPPKLKILCIKNNISDAELAVDLATEIAKLNTHMVQREQALKKSKELLFTELCNYMGLKDEEVKKKWRKMSEDDKWVLVKVFVSSGWGANFHPLSARSVKEMVDEYLVEDNPSSSNASAPNLFHGLKRLMGFSQDSKGESDLK